CNDAGHRGSAVVCGEGPARIDEHEISRDGRRLAVALDKGRFAGYIQTELYIVMVVPRSIFARAHDSARLTVEGGNAQASKRPRFDLSSKTLAASRLETVAHKRACRRFPPKGGLLVGAQACG